MTLDGKVATRSGDSKWISGGRAAPRAHEWRAECDAVAVGIGTALADDPQLTARIPGVEKQPRRIVFDSLGRLPLESKLVEGARETPLTVVVSGPPPGRHRRAQDARCRGDRGHGRARARAGPLGPASARRGRVSAILLEGGPRLAGAFLDAGEIDEMRLFLAPTVLGGRTARDPARGRGGRDDRRRHPGARDRGASGSTMTC